jgi:hypothetical protein
MEKETGKIKPLIYSMLLASLIVFLASIFIARSQVTLVGKAIANGFIKSADIMQKIDWLSGQAFIWYGILLVIGLLCALGISYILHTERRLNRVFERFKMMKPAEPVSDEDKKAIDDLKDYIVKMASMNYTKDQINQLLLQADWDQKTIDSVMRNVGINA